MSPAPVPHARFVVICVDDERESLDALRRDLEDLCLPMIEIEACTAAAEALSLIEGLHPPKVRIPLVIADHEMPGMSGIDLLEAIHARADHRATRKILLAARPTVEDLTRLLNQGALHRHLVKPWTVESLRGCTRALLTSFFIHHAPEEVDRLGDLLDAGQFPRAYQVARRTRQTLDAQITTLKRSFLGNMDMSDEEVDEAMEAAIDEALNSPPRRDHATGAVLLRQDEPVDTISILLAGHVQLSRRTEDREVILHTHSAGRIIGLLSLAHRQRAFYTCRALTDVTVLPLTLEQLDTALQANPYLTSYFVTALIRSMATRSKRTAQLKVEVEHLNSELRAERDELAEALGRLERAQTRLVASEKMATLGQLTAGIAHELNNPTAAIRRAADFIAEDITALVERLPDAETIKSTIMSAITDTPLSTRELRKHASALAAAVGDAALTRRLVKIGILTASAYRARFGSLSADERAQLLGSLERYHELGTALRNLRSCGARISGIVQSLRSYARSDEGLVGGVDVHEGLEDTLRLFNHALRNINLVRRYGEVPRIECNVGELNQVWTNLVSNALHALGEAGTLRVETDAPDPEHVRVRIIDSGAGIAPEMLERIFDLHFTTKRGRVEFGLGMGLPICRQIVHRHGGEITARSKRGETCFTVVLPLRRPRWSAEEVNA